MWTRKDLVQNKLLWIEYHHFMKLVLNKSHMDQFYDASILSASVLNLLNDRSQYVSIIRQGFSTLNVGPNQWQHMHTLSGVCVHVLFLVNDNTFGKTHDKHNVCPICSLRNKNHKQIWISVCLFFIFHLVSIKLNEKRLSWLKNNMKHLYRHAWNGFQLIQIIFPNKKQHADWWWEEWKQRLVRFKSEQNCIGTSEPERQ